jgi:hypothetical protein
MIFILKSYMIKKIFRTILPIYLFIYLSFEKLLLVLQGYGIDTKSESRQNDEIYSAENHGYYIINLKMVF